MGRATRSWLPVLLALLALPACGDGRATTRDGAVTTLRAASAPSASGPTLRGRTPRPSVHTAVGQDADAPAPPPARDEHGALRVPAGASWGDVQSLLSQAARLGGKRLPVSGGTMQRLSDGVGDVVVDGVPGPGWSGLRVEIEADPATTRITQVGSAWVVRAGCDARRVFDFDGHDEEAWRTALRELRWLRGADLLAVEVRAAAAVPASVVLAFLRAVTEADGGPAFVRTGTRRVFEDAPSGAAGWLAAHQAPGGAWDARFAELLCDGRPMADAALPGDPASASDPAQTGMVLLTYLGMGYTFRGKHPFARVVGRGLRHLKNVQQEDGSFPAAPVWSRGRAQGFATLALVEAFGMTGSPIVKGAARRALDALPAAYRGSGDDPLCTALTAMALASARWIEADRRGRDQDGVFELDAELLAAVRREAAREDVGAGDLRAACALLVRILLDGPAARTAAEVEAGAAALARTFEARGAHTDPVFVWIGTLVCFQVGGTKAWRPWKQLLETHVLERQRTGGHVCCTRASYDPPADATLPGGRVTATALLTLATEVFYRYDKVFGVRTPR